jgi:TetR/AcrR family transcriptional regulator
MAHRLATRDRILDTAAAEFAARGFAATRVDRIARQARVNKAMIYYHFDSKLALYTEILREVYLAVGDRLAAIAARDVSAAAKLDALLDTLVEAVDAHPHFLPILMRELAEGGAHLGRDTLQLIGRTFGLVRGILGEGVRDGEFAPMHPGLAWFSMLGPLVMFRMTAPVRAKITKLGIAELPDVDRDMLVHHLQTIARRILARPIGEDSHVTQA